MEHQSLLGRPISSIDQLDDPLLCPHHPERPEPECDSSVAHSHYPSFPGKLVMPASIYHEKIGEGRRIRQLDKQWMLVRPYGIVNNQESPKIKGEETYQQQDHGIKTFRWVFSIEWGKQNRVGGIIQILFGNRSDELRFKEAIRSLEWYQWADKLIE